MANLAEKICNTHRIFLDNIVNLGLVRDSNPLINNFFLSSEDGYVNHLTWNKTCNLSYLFGDYLSIKQYLNVLDRRDYTILFSDGAVLQVDYLIREAEILKHRLCYLPSPIEYEPGDLYDLTLDEYIACISNEELVSATRLVTPVRFDFHYKHRDEKHEHSHLTLNKSSCRIPGYGPVSLAHFLKFMMRYFYEDHFESEGIWDGIEPAFFNRTLAHPSPHEFHFDSSIGR